MIALNSELQLSQGTIGDLKTSVKEVGNLSYRLYPLLTFRPYPSHPLLPVTILPLTLHSSPLPLLHTSTPLPPSHHFPYLCHTPHTPPSLTPLSLSSHPSPHIPLPPLHPFPLPFSSLTSTSPPHVPLPPSPHTPFPLPHTPSPSHPSSLSLSHPSPSLTPFSPLTPFTLLTPSSYPLSLPHTPILPSLLSWWVRTRSWLRRTSPYRRPHRRSVLL